MIRNLVTATCLSLLAAACADLEKPAYTLPYAPDVRDRHPMVLKNELTTLDIYPTQVGGLELRQKVDLQDFARTYGPAGKSALVVSSPYKGSGADNASVDQHVGYVVKALVSAGVPRSSIELKKYQALQYDRIEPIKLAYVQLEAGLPHECGQWPDDLGADSGIANLENLTHANFGCAHQQNIAAQIANPMDVVRPARETAPDSTQRVLMLRKFVAGEPTSTSRPPAQSGGGDSVSSSSAN
ncbi:CpaD family pilus assembly protein [Microvirga sp. BT688]|uniref:CpaD family pilus assembly protein n=1 Tax=Microvirga sp. TaxID=1873136 RepID=UPI00168A3478|nr:CpaD family pilus assembly lipoprotein [Microvirga sp.]MBD2745779.1 CpaD family pilus assembly protein [Microvirga sp.]